MAAITIFGNRKSLIQKCKQPEILVYTDDNECLEKSMDITGNRIVKFKYKIEIDGFVIKETSKYICDNIEEKVIIPKEVISNVKKGKATKKLTITVIQDDGEIITKDIDVIINSQRKFARKFNGNSKIVTQVDKDFLNDKKIEVILNNGLVDDTTAKQYVKLEGSNLIIGDKQSCIIEEVRIWEKDKGVIYDKSPLCGNEEGLVLYYRMNEYEGNICIDSSGNNHHGFYINAEMIKDNINTKDVLDSKILLKESDAIVPQDTNYIMNFDIKKPFSIENNVIECVTKDGETYIQDIDFSNFEKVDGITVK